MKIYRFIEKTGTNQDYITLFPLIFMVLLNCSDTIAVLFPANQCLFFTKL
jgi:hypothetical protein